MWSGLERKRTKKRKIMTRSNVCLFLTNGFNVSDKLIFKMFRNMSGKHKETGPMDDLEEKSQPLHTLPHTSKVFSFSCASSFSLLCYEYEYSPSGCNRNIS